MQNTEIGSASLTNAITLNTEMRKCVIEKSWQDLARSWKDLGKILQDLIKILQDFGKILQGLG
jgi:hypothetical protein